MKDISKPKSVHQPTGPEEPVIYLEADEEITAATSRMLASKSKEVRIVVPKRSTLLQSVVNQKLLKRAADNAGKSLVLVTADRTASHLAAQVGIPVAATVKAAAAIPEADAAPAEDTSDIVEAASSAEEAPVEPPKPKKSPKPAYATPMMKSEPKVNNPFATDEIDSPAPVAATKAAKAPKIKKNRRVPDFNSLPKKVLIGGGIVLAIILLFVAQFYFKRANVTLYAAGQLVDVDVNFKVDPNTDSVSVTTATLPGRKYEMDKDLTGTAPATGTKDVGTKASGTMTIKNSYDSSPHTFVAGTRFQAPNGLIFLSTESVTVPGASLSGGSIVPGSATVGVQASQNGDQYNLAPTTYTMPGLPPGQQALIKGSGSQMNGGTSKEIKVVTQADVDKAKNEAIDKEKESATKELEDKASKDQMILPESFTATPSSVTASPGVDNEGTQTTVKIKVTYSILTIKQDDLETFVTAIEKKQVGAEKQVYQSGVDNGKITSANGAFNFKTTASAGKKIDTDALIQEIKGKRSGAAIDVANKVPGVGKAEITMSPSWSVKLPTILDHIKVEIKVEEKSNSN